MRPNVKLNKDNDWGAVWRAPTVLDAPAPRRPATALTLGIVAVFIAVGLACAIGLAPDEKTPVLSTRIEDTPQAQPQAAAIEAKRSNRVSYQPISGVTMVEKTFTLDALIKGKLMVVSADAPLPKGAPSPNTYSLSALSKGVVPVKDSSVKTSKECANALNAFFTEAKRMGVDGLMVWRGTLSPAQQRQWQLEKVNAYAMEMTLEAAIHKTQQEIDNPLESEHQTANTVDILVYFSHNGVLDDRPLSATAQGRYLLDNAWRYGLIQRYPSMEDNEDKRNQFRYVGQAHATIMHELELDYDCYLQLLHEKKTLIYQEKGIPRYVIACLPIQGEEVSFLLPSRCVVEASLDNLGYAVVTCGLLE